MEAQAKNGVCPVTFNKGKTENPIALSNPEVKKPITFTDRSKAKCPITFNNEFKPERPVTFSEKKSAPSLHADTSDKKRSIKADKPPKVIRVKEKTENLETADLTNYHLTPSSRRIYVRRDGSVDMTKSEIELKIMITGTTIVDTLRIKIYDIDKITKIVGRFYPEAILYNKKDADKVSNSFRENCKHIKIVYCYLDAGWHLINGKPFYLHKGIYKDGIEIMTPLSLPFNRACTYGNLPEICKQAFSLYNDFDIASTLFLYSLLGVCYKLFDEAGYAPHFLLFMTGKTGSFKTTIAKLLFTQLADPKYRDYPRRIDADTVTSFERGIVISGVDTVTLIDDYSPAKSQKNAIDMANKLESIIRMVGDGSTKSRSNTALDDCRGEGVKGMVVLTGELQGKGLSSNLRCLYCEIEKSKVNLQAVTWFQQNTDYYCTFIQHFAYFIAGYWDTLKKIIKDGFERYRRTAEKFLSVQRLVDVIATMCSTTDIFHLFLVLYCKLQENDVKTQMGEIKNAVLNVVKRSEMLSIEEEPSLRFMKVLIDLINKGTISVPCERPTETSIICTDGFIDKNYVYLLPENAYQKVTHYLKTCGVYFGIDMEHLGKILCQEGYAVPSPNGKKKQTYYSRIDIGDGRKINFLKIPRTVINSILEAMDGKE